MGLADIAGKLIDSLTGGGLSRPVIEDGNGTTLTLDVVTEQVQDANSIITRHAVESAEGSVSDHTKAEPENLNLKIILSNHTGVGALNPASYGKALKSTLGGLTGGLIGGTEDTIKPRLELLTKWKDSGTLLKYRSKNLTFNSCVVAKITKSATKETGDGLALNITLTEINIANADEVTVELAKPPGARKTKVRKSSAEKKISKWINS